MGYNIGFIGYKVRILYETCIKNICSSLIKISYIAIKSIGVIQSSLILANDEARASASPHDI